MYARKDWKRSNKFIPFQNTDCGDYRWSLRCDGLLAPEDTSVLLSVEDVEEARLQDIGEAEGEIRSADQRKRC